MFPYGTAANPYFIFSRVIAFSMCIPCFNGGRAINEGAALGIMFPVITKHIGKPCVVHITGVGEV